MKVAPLHDLRVTARRRSLVSTNNKPNGVLAEHSCKCDLHANAFEFALFKRCYVFAHMLSVLTDNVLPCCRHVDYSTTHAPTGSGRWKSLGDESIRFRLLLSPLMISFSFW